MPDTASRDDRHVFQSVLAAVLFSFSFSLFGPWWRAWFFYAHCLVRRVDAAPGAEDYWPWHAAAGLLEDGGGELVRSVRLPGKSASDLILFAPQNSLP